MIDKQVKQIVKKIAVNDYIMENMFCAPKGALGRFGGQLMSQDRWLPAWVLDLLEIQPSDSVLEVGFGPGLGLQLAAARTYDGKIVGVDQSETMLEMARHRNQALIDAGRIELRRGSADNLPFDQATFEKAMAINTHHIWRDPVAGLKDIRRTLRAGGRIAVAITRFSYASPAKFEGHLISAGFTDVSMHTGEPGVCALGRA